MRYLTADLHLGHEKISEYCGRPFKSVGEMDSTLIRNWNSVVKEKDDEVIVIGDFTLKGAEYKNWFHRTLRSLNGTKMLIFGNHDSMHALDYVEVGFHSAHTSLVIDGIFLAHDPAWANALPKDMSMFCGHVHELFVKLSRPRRVLNVGVDVWDYRPISWNKAVEELNKDF